MTNHLPSNGERLQRPSRRKFTDPSRNAFDRGVSLIILSCLFASAILFGGYLVNSSVSRASSIPPLLIVAVSVFAVFCARTVFSSKYGLADIIVGYFFLFSFAFVGIYQNAVGVFPWLVAHDAGSASVACLIFIIFLSFFMVAREFGLQVKQTRSYTFDDRRALTSTAIIISISAVAFLAAGPANVLNPRAALDLAVDGRVPQITAIGRPLALVALLYLISHIKRAGITPSTAPLIFASAVMTYIWYNPISTPRLHFVALLFSVAVTAASLWSMSSTSKSATYAALFALNYLILGPLKSFSDGIDKVNTSFYDDILKNIKTYAFRVDFDVFQTASNGALYVSQQGILYLKPLVGIIGFFIPREIWPDKPVGTSLLVHQYLGYPYTNLSYPLPTEAYTAGGIIAVAISGVMLGLAVNFLTRLSRNAQSLGSSSAETIVYAVITGYMPIILRGPINSVFPLFGVAFIGVAAMMIFSRRAR